MTDILHDNSASSQRSRILQHLLQKGPLSTLEARRKGICHIGMRVCELRKSGHQVITHWTNDLTQDGSVHRVALYVLQPKKQLALPGMEGDR